MAYSGTYRIRIPPIIQIADTATNYIQDISPLRKVLNALEIAERETRVRQRESWKEPRKPIRELIPPVISQFERIFTGHNFPVGGPKK